MAITVATVIGNACLSRRWKADSIYFRSCIRSLASITHHMAQKPDRTAKIQSVHNVSRTKAGLQNAVTTIHGPRHGPMRGQRDDTLRPHGAVVGIHHRQRARHRR
jgi:hypothetical protein